MKMRWTVLAIAALMSAGARADEASAFKDRTEQESYAIGAQTGRTLKKDNVDINVGQLIRGLQDGLGGGKLQMSEQELRAVMSRVQQDLHRNMVINRRAAGEHNRELAASFLAENGRKAGVITTPSGLQYRVVRPGSGRKPVLGSTVMVNFRGTRLDGFEFDASEEGKPATMVAAQTIAGWKEALQLMSVGAKWQLVVPSNLAYGERGSGADIGPNQLLLFDLELVDVKE